MAYRQDLMDFWKTEKIIYHWGSGKERDKETDSKAFKMCPLGLRLSKRMARSDLKERESTWPRPD